MTFHEEDYRRTVFSKGVVCMNTNNHQYCVVIDGTRGTEDDRGSLVLEFCGENGYMLHTPPNRALKPTGRTVNLQFLAKTMAHYVAIDNEQEAGKNDNSRNR